MKRLFIAIPIQLDQDFTSCVDQLKQGTTYDSITWVQSNVQHLTLRFLGATPEGKIEQLIKTLDNVLKETQSFNLIINKLGVFGSHYKPTTLWLGFEDFTPLKEIHNAMEEALTEIGFDADHGNFVPHITLGRIKNIINKNKFWTLFQQNQTTHQQIVHVDRIILYQSKLRPEGPIYRELKHWDLNR